MFSIIIPLYNKALYIQKALQSIYNQTYKGFEVIVVNDGSKDNSAEEVQKFIEKNTPQNFYFISQENQGVSTARNNGVKLSKYPYICFLDADDWWEDTFLLELKNLIEEYPKAGIYGTSYFKVKDRQNIPANIGVEKGFEKGIINYYKVYTKTLWMPLWTGAVSVSKKIYEEFSGFKSELKLGEDFYLWVRIAYKYSVAFLNKPLAYYNQDVDGQNRAIGNKKFYKPKEHMLFADYGDIMENKDFHFLYEKLALYGLLPYYLNDKNKKEVKNIITNIDFSNHEKKYDIYYNKLPKIVLKKYFKLLKFISNIKRNIISYSEKS